MSDGVWEHIAIKDSRLKNVVQSVEMNKDQ